jgi:hypothetical protein
MFWEVVCDEHGNGGSGEYCGISDAQLGRITVLLASHTSGLRDVPRYGALSLLQKTHYYRGGSAETAAGLNAIFWVMVVRGWW